MGRADVPGILVLIAGRHYDRDALVVGVGDAFLQVFVVGIAAQAEVDDLGPGVDGIADAVADHGGVAHARGVHGPDGQDIDLDPGRAVDDRARHMGAVAVSVRGVPVVVDKVHPGGQAAVEPFMGGDAAVDDGDLDGPVDIGLDIGGIPVGLHVGGSPGHGLGRGRGDTGFDGGVVGRIPALCVPLIAGRRGSGITEVRWCLHKGKSVGPRRPGPGLSGLVVSGIALKADLADLCISDIDGGVIRLHIGDRGQGFYGGGRLFRGASGGELHDADAESALYDRLCPVGAEIDLTAAL